MQYKVQTDGEQETLNLYTKDTVKYTTIIREACQGEKLHISIMRASKRVCKQTLCGEGSSLGAAGPPPPTGGIEKESSPKTLIPVNAPLEESGLRIPKN